MSNEVAYRCTYRDHPAIAQSDLKMYFESPMSFYLHKVRGIPRPDRKTPSMEFGTLVDRFILEPESIKGIPADVLASNGAKSGNKWKAFRAKWEGEHGMTLVTEKELEQLVSIQEFARDHHQRVHRILWEHKQETHLQLYWECPHTGLQRKAEIDLWLPSSEHRFVVDVKTTQDPGPAFERMIYQYGYHIQAATYLEGLTASGHEPLGYLLVAIRNTWPYDCELYDLRYVIPEGERFNEREMKKLAADLESDAWAPATSAEAKYPEPPSGYLGSLWEREEPAV